MNEKELDIYADIARLAWLGHRQDMWLEWENLDEEDREPWRNVIRALEENGWIKKVGQCQE